MTDRPDTVKDQSQGQAPSTQASAPEAPILQIPFNEERAKKTDRQEETPTGRTTEQKGEKRQRLSPYAKEEFTEETTGNQRGEETIEQRIPPSMEISASSFQQEQERQQGVEVTSTSTRKQSKESSDIKKEFIDIKARNEPLRFQLYNQLLRWLLPINRG